MNVGAVTFQPYVYNANSVSSQSLNRINGIGEDLLASKTDFSGITEDKNKQQNENPLRMGETKNFTDILMSQMQMGRMNAARVMTQPEQTQNTATANAIDPVKDMQETTNNLQRMQQASDAYKANMIA